MTRMVCAEPLFSSRESGVWVPARQRMQRDQPPVTALGLGSGRTGLQNAEELDPQRAGGLCQRSHRGRKGRGQIPKFSTSQAPTNPSYWPKPEELANAACRGVSSQHAHSCDSKRDVSANRLRTGMTPELLSLTPLSQGPHREEKRGSIEAPPAST